MWKDILKCNLVMGILEIECFSIFMDSVMGCVKVSENNQ